MWPFKWKLLNITFLWYCFIMLYKVVLTFESGWIVKCDHSDESYRAILFSGIVLPLQSGSNSYVWRWNPTPGLTIEKKLTWTNSYLNILVNALSLSKALPRYFRTLSPARKNSLVPPRIDSVSGNSLMTLNANSNYCPLMICTSKTCLLWETIIWLSVGEAYPHPTPSPLGMKHL